MSLQPQSIGPIPEETARVARAAFPKGNLYLQVRDELGVIYDDQDFASLFSTRGQPAEAPWRLALVTVFQFVEGLTDRQAAEAVRSRLDWKYALGLELTDSGFDFSILCEFRARLITGGSEQRMLDKLLEQFKTRGWLKSRGSQRTDSTHVLAAIRTITRLELVGETVRATLNNLAAVAPEWLHSQMDPQATSGWLARYSVRVESYRLPKNSDECRQLAVTIGLDGSKLLHAIYDPTAPKWLREIPAVQTLRKVWLQQYLVQDGQLQWRSSADLPPSSLLICSPYDPQARYGIKRTTSWTGYKVHLTETCDADLDQPHLITHVETTPATTPDGVALENIHRSLEAKNLLPANHLLDSAYVDAEALLRSQTEHGVAVCGPAPPDMGWQKRSGEGFDTSCFVVDWERQSARCPQGKASVMWTPIRDRYGKEMIHIRFAQSDCGDCPVRPRCTRAATMGRSITLHPREQHAALQAARERQESEAFKAQYAARSGIEGTLSQATRAFELRRSRYRGLAKTRLQHVLTAVAVNLMRMFAWWNERPRTQTHPSRFAVVAMNGLNGLSALSATPTVAGCA